jgi:hypothetical protein
MYDGLPTPPVIEAKSSELSPNSGKIRARPKSQILSVKLASTNTFSGWKERRKEEDECKRRKPASE